VPFLMTTVVISPSLAPKRFGEAYDRVVNDKHGPLGGECERLKTEILAYMGHAGSLTSRGKTLATWKCARSSQRVDTKALALAHPEIAAEFSHQCVGSRRFLLKEAA